ncbi:DUF883 domain-containing protein [Salinicola endophyticus]|uniref:DUF883 domain-containing protein n=1 Tax=Salinicola endophyticus TaxID=1949083 RepID=A0ABY8FNP2_9GAMM|nr:MULTISPECIES: DUF883 family protein [Salinicola]WFF43283.1 DUF883 domain-containing protein [Salinicola endophyticus]
MSRHYRDDARHYYRDAKQRGRAGVQRARQRADDMSQDLMEHAGEAWRDTDDYVHRNAWSGIGVAALAGFAIGFFVGRR